MTSTETLAERTATKSSLVAQANMFDDIAAAMLVVCFAIMTVWILQMSRRH